jgi:hypothetical protein
MKGSRRNLASNANALAAVAFLIVAISISPAIRRVSAWSS